MTFLLIKYEIGIHSPQGTMSLDLLWSISILRQEIFNWLVSEPQNQMLIWWTLCQDQLAVLWAEVLLIQGWLRDQVPPVKGLWQPLFSGDRMPTVRASPTRELCQLLCLRVRTSPSVLSGTLQYLDSQLQLQESLTTHAQSCHVLLQGHQRHQLHKLTGDPQ